MRALLDNLVEELRELKREGIEEVAVQPASLVALQQAVRARYSASDVSAKVVEPMPAENAPAADAPSKSLSASPESKPVRTRVEAAQPPAAALPAPPELDLPDGDKATRYAWLRERVLGCPVCNAHVRAGKKVVIGSGNLDSPLFFCGEAPGADEEVQGEVFVGPAGQLLNKIIVAMGLQREAVYVGNIMNWRPEVAVGNRPPTQEEMTFCLPYLRAQLAIVQPKVIVALGKTAMEGLLGFERGRSLRKARGRWHAFDDTPLMVTYHPSYLLRNDTLKTKREVWEDMLLVMERLEMPISEKQRGYFLKS